MPYNVERDKKLVAAWTKFFIEGDENVAGIRNIILESWKRSREYGINHMKIEKPVASQKAIREKIHDNLDMVDISRAYMENLYRYIDDEGFIVILADRNGFILETIVDERKRKSLTSSRLVPGAVRDEKTAGTNAIGTCLHTGEPLQMISGEHFYKEHHNWTCSASPIHGLNGEIIGCLDISGPKEQVHPHTLGMVMSAVDGIEKELRLNDYLNSLTVKNNQLKSIINTISDGVVYIDRNHNIKLFNKKFLSIFKIGKNDIKDRNISDFKALSKQFMEFIKRDEEIFDEEMNLKINGEYSSFNVSISIVTNNLDEKDGILAILKDSKKVHKLVNKISGSEAQFNFDNIIGNSDKINECIEVAKLSAKTSSNVLLLGESGTGKEMFAQSIHNHSDRRDGPFIAINCGALPRGIIESELFGYEGGSFTGSRKEGRPGKFELADGGTIFLDEIGDTPLDVQVTLLRVLQNREVIRVGGYKPKKIDVRVISATNKNLLEEIKANSFRADLFYRINVFSLSIPPLRERPGDTSQLLQYFIDKYCNQGNISSKRFDSESLNFLMSYSWPGNVRELENIVERCVYTTTDNIITIYNLPKYITSGENQITNEHAVIPVQKMKIPRKSEKERIIEALIANDGIVKNAAGDLGFDRRTLYRKAKKYEIDLTEYRN